jgi:predicted house-cleaning noncanonical NTP pyrophosphatase (MazG superfamily)
LFKLFVSFLKDADLIGCEIIAIDGTKSRAHNSKKANFNQKKIDRHLVYIEERTQEYLAELAKMIYRIIALQSLRLQKNRAIKRINYATNF